MAVRLTERGPAGTPRARRFARLVAHLAGYLISAIRIASATVIFWGLWVGFAELSAALRWHGGVARAVFVGAGLATPVYAVTTLLAPRLLMVNRHKVLFLRRFGFGPATRVVSASAARLGSDWRLVTLDDGKTAQIRVGGAVGGLSRLLRITFWPFDNLWTVARFVLIPSLVASFLIGRVWPEVETFTSGPLAIRVIYDAILLPDALLMLYFVLFVLLLGPLNLLTDLNWDDPKDESQSTQITSADASYKALALVRGAAEAAVGPRLMVVKVESPDDQLWRTAVSDLSVQYSDVALIDVSQLTENVLWEIELLTRTNPTPCVFVAEESRAATIVSESVDDALSVRLRNLLDGRTVIVYRSEGRRSTRGFIRALRAGLEEAVTEQRLLVAEQRDAAWTGLGRAEPPQDIGRFDLVGDVPPAPAARAARPRRYRHATFWYLLAALDCAATAAVAMGVAVAVDEASVGLGMRGFAPILVDEPLGRASVVAWAFGCFVLGLLPGGQLRKTLVESTQHPLLFLRRRGRVDSTRVVSSALPRMGAIWHSCVVDDQRIRAHSAPRERHTLTIRHVGELLDLLTSTRAAGRRIFGRRHVFINVDGASDAPWEAVLVGYARTEGVTLVDLSELPTDRLLKDIEYLVMHRLPCVFVAEQSATEHLVRAPAGHPAIHRLRALLNGRPVLTYDSARRSQREFRQALRHSIQNAVPPRSAASFRGVATSIARDLWDGICATLDPLRAKIVRRRSRYSDPRRQS